MEPIKLLWVDPEHMWAWEPILSRMKDDGFEVTQFPNLNHAAVIRKCAKKHVVVIHSGTIEPVAGLRQLLLGIRQRYPKIKIGLQTNCKPPFVADLVDFTVHCPSRRRDVESLLQDVVNGEP